MTTMIVIVFSIGLALLLAYLISVRWGEVSDGFAHFAVCRRAGAK